MMTFPYPGLGRPPSSNCRANRGSDSALRQSFENLGDCSQVGNEIELQLSETGDVLFLFRDEHRSTRLPSETRGLRTRRRPDVDRRADDVHSCIVDEISTEILVTHEDLDVARERKNSWIRGDDSGSHPAAATCCPTQTVLR